MARRICKLHVQNFLFFWCRILTTLVMLLYACSALVFTHIPYPMPSSCRLWINKRRQRPIDGLLPTAHALDIVCKGHRRAKLRLRTFTVQDIGLLIRAYVVYVRPFVQHHSIFWSPCTNKHIETVECVQRRFTKNLQGYSGYLYLERLRHLELQIEYRHLLFNLIFCFKIVFGIVDVQMDDFFSFSTYTLTNCHNKYRLYKKRTVSQTRANFLVNES